jgi:pSer/pThr/pTyr-binding forkhead associated (FHA) protein
VRDLGSANGTLLNGTPLEGSKRVGKADLVLIGSAALRVVDAPPEGVTRLSPAPVVRSSGAPAGETSMQAGKETRRSESAGPAPPAASAYLADAGGQRWALKPAITLIGRALECDVVIGDASVSRRHAAIERRGDGWALISLSRDNPTLLNGQAVPPGGAVLKREDVITLGLQVKLVFEA